MSVRRASAAPAPSGRAVPLVRAEVTRQAFRAQTTFLVKRLTQKTPLAEPLGNQQVVPKQWIQEWASKLEAARKEAERGDEADRELERELQRDLDEYKADLKELTNLASRKNEAAGADLAQLRAAVAAEKARVKELQAELDNELANSSSMLAALNQQLEDLDTAGAAKDKRVKELEAELDEELASSSSIVAELNDKIEKLEKYKAEKEQELAELDAAGEEDRLTIKELESDVDSLNELVSRYAEEVSKSEARTAVKAKLIADLRQQRAGLKAELSSFKKLLEQVDEQDPPAQQASAGQLFSGEL